MKTDPLFKFLQRRKLITTELYKGEAGLKKYDRFPTVVLPPPKELSISLSEAVRARESIRKYNANPISLSQISNLLYWAGGLSGKKNEKGIRKRAYPSGGAKYPIEMYLFFWQENDPVQGVYHYNVQEHKLEELIFVKKDFEKNIIIGENSSRENSVIILFTFKKSRSFGKYGNLAYRLGLIESGCIVQSIYLIASALGLGCCAYGMARKEEEGTKELLCLEDESILFSVSLGGLVE